MEKPDVQFQMIAQTLFGLEDVLANELEGIGATEVVTHNRAVRFTGDQACMYRANLCLHSALRILVPINAFAVRGEQELYQVIRAMPWEDLLDAEDTLAVHCTLNTDLFHHSQYLALKTKDAICDRFREKTGKRPSVDVELPTLRIFLHVHGEKDRCRRASSSPDFTGHA